MNLFVFITNHVELIAPILSEFMDKDIHGASIVECEGMLQALGAASIDPPPIFGSLRNFLNPDHEPGKMLLAVLNDAQVETAKDVVHNYSGGLDRPNRGILFVLPVSYAEGVK